ncbi:MAG: molybdate ABC transporter substrate-binding protein [Halomonas sp.]|uniref:molybdate ABC transporter substrate-binding protein n=1 Tax=Halomonas sp. TaxID=1486246 RepID=UPI003F90C4E7
MAHSLIKSISCALHPYRHSSAGHLAQHQELELDSPDELRDSKRFARITLPDTDKAIYGRAGSEHLEHDGLINAVNERLLVVGTVPQATAYVTTGEVDAGFINLTDALANAERFGGYLVLDEHYDPIRIVAAVTAQHADTPEVLDFIDYVDSPAAHTIATNHGL